MIVKKLAKYSSLITLGGFAILVLFIWYSNQQIEKQNGRLKELNDALQQKQAKMELLIAEENALVDGITDLYKMSLNSFGWPLREVDSISIDDPKVQQAIKANDQVRQYIMNDNFNISRTTTLQYYPKDKDMNKVKFAFEELGFKLLTKPSNPNLLEKESNAIWYGDEIAIEEVKLAAYILIRAGVNVKFILNSQSLDDHKIMVGTIYANHPIILRAKNIPVDSIQRAESFKKVPKLSPYSTN